jgi:hypothetical protein
MVGYSNKISIWKTVIGNFSIILYYQDLFALLSEIIKITFYYAKLF